MNTLVDSVDTTGIAEAARLDRPAAADSIFRASWSALDDEALLAHYRSARGVHVDLVVDEDECSDTKLQALVEGRFEFNGETHLLPDPVEWLVNPSADVEWHILLHKFYYAPGLGRAFLRTGDARLVRRWSELIDGWIRATPPGFIAADVTGRRVQNWIYSLRAFVWHGARPVAQLDGAFFRRMLESLHQQVEYLCEHLTPKRNHRTLELYAVFLAGITFPEMKRSAFWRALALRETLANMRADLLADGVHCELSTDYHHLALRNWLHVRNLAERHEVPVEAEMDHLLERALEFSLHVHKPDGVVPSLSDGDARSFLPLLATGAALFGRDDMRWAATGGAAGLAPAHTSVHFSASGYTVLRSTWGLGPDDHRQAQYLVFDTGPLGEGNHGHFDCLNFELAAYGRSLVVDPGRYTYSEAPIGDSAENWRVRFRSTAAHNTVCVDGLNQTRYVPKTIKEASRHSTGSVRHKVSGPAPRAVLLEFAQAPGCSLLHGRAASAEYDAVHERVIVLVDRRYWIVSDALRAPTMHDYALTFQLSERAWTRTRLRRADDVRIDSPGLVLVQPGRSGQASEIRDSWVSPRYGEKFEAPAVVCRARGADVDFDTVLVPWQSDAPDMRVTDEPVTRAICRPGHEACEGPSVNALRIEIGLEGARVIDTWFHARGAESPSWDVAGLSFTGRWILLRHDEAGALRRAVSHAGASLTLDGRPVDLEALAEGVSR